MVKQLWLALGLGVAVFAGVAVALAGPGATWAQATPEQLSTVGVASGLTAALLALFVSVFLGLAIADWIELRRGRARLDALLALARTGDVVEPRDLTAALSGGPLGDAAKSYAYTLRIAADGERHYVGADPGEFFVPERLIDDRLYLTAFRRLTTVLIVLSAAALAFGLKGLLADYAAGATGASLAADGQAVLVGCGFPLFGAVVVGGLVPLVVALLRRQLAGLIGRVGLLFHGADEQFYVRRLLEAQSTGAADMRRSVSQALGEVRKLFESLRRRIEDQPMFNGTSNASRGDDKATVRMIQESLSGLSAEFGRQFATQLEGLSGILASTEAAASRLEHALGAAARDVQERSAALDARTAGIEFKLEQAVDRLGEVAERLGRSVSAEPVMQLEVEEHAIAQKLDQVTERLAQVGATMAAAAEQRHAADGEATAALAGRLDALGNALSEQATGSAAAMKQLYTTVDSLCLSVAPVLNRLVDTQDDLLAALSGENTTSRLLADVAEDLRQLSRVNRETVERHVQLAGELAKIGQIIETAATQPQVAAAVPDGEAVKAEPKVSDGLMRALRELQTEAEAAQKALPRLDDVA